MQLEGAAMPSEMDFSVDPDTLVSVLAVLAGLLILGILNLIIWHFVRKDMMATRNSGT